MGGRPILGYDLDRETKKLVVNQAEAKQVQQIFQLYLQHQSLLPVVQELSQRRWVNKRWVTLKNEVLEGTAFTRTALHKLLTSPLYIGQVTYKGERHAGQQPGIIELGAWQEVQDLLAANCRQVHSAASDREPALLQGLLRCGACQCAMTPATASKKGPRTYRYYVCTSAQARGWQTCPSKSVPAVEIERFVVEQVRMRLRELDTGELGQPDALVNLAASDAGWETLGPSEQVALIRRLVSQVIHDGTSQKLTLQLNLAERTPEVVA